MRSLVPEATIRRLVLKNVSILFFGTQISNIVVVKCQRVRSKELDKLQFVEGHEQYHKAEQSSVK